MMDPIQTAYAAGLFEGEGTVYTDGQNYPHASIRMTDREPLERMLATCGGKLYGPYVQHQQNRKDTYLWSVWGWDAVEAFFERLGDHLSPRRVAQFQRVLATAPPPDERARGWPRRNQTHCKRGHPFDAQNTGRQGKQRFCRTCRRESDRARRH